MSKKNATPNYDADVAVKQPKRKKKGSGLLGRIIRRFFLVVFTIIILAVAALCLVLNTVFQGPSDAAREVLTMSLLEPSGTKWIPPLFLDEETLNSIRYKSGDELEDDFTNTELVVINKDNVLTGGDEWAGHPDGIRIEEYKGATFNAHIMIVRDPSAVFMGTSTEKYSTDIPGKRLNEAMDAAGESVIAAVNAGAFFDNGTSDPIVGSVPAGLVYSNGKQVWNAYHGFIPAETGGGFVGFNTDNILVVAKSITPEQAEELNIRDGCEFGPVLIMNGEVNMEAYNKASGWNPRSAIGQREDGAIIFVCIDGRQAGSIGGTYKDVTDIMIEYGAVNACNLDGGSSSVMMYRDMQGLYGEPGTVQMINSYSVLQSQPRRMPNYWMVRASSEE